MTHAPPPVTIAWATDLHLPHARGAARARVLAALGRAAETSDAVVITGDIGTAETLTADLRRLRNAVRPTPLHVVLGNHDFYGGAIGPVRDRTEALAEAWDGLVYLTRSGPVPLSAEVALVGHDGWGDARLGRWRSTELELNDFHLVDDLAGLDRRERVERLRALGDEAARHLEHTLRSALAGHDRVVVATHVPPFADAAWHEGHRSDPDWLPYFACRAAGEAILRAAGDHPGARLLVLCGHTHGGGENHPVPNVRVRTGRAEYGSPSLNGILTVGGHGGGRAE